MIELNYNNIKKEIICEGLDIGEDFQQYAEQIKQIILNLNSQKDKPGKMLQWMNLGYNEETAWYVKEFASMVEGRFENILILGIGGSALGGKAVCNALLPSYWNDRTKEQRNNKPKIYFLDNIDPNQIHDLLGILDLKKTLVNVITKSGQTAETMAQYMIIKDYMEKELGEDYRMNIVATTDAYRGNLIQLANQEGYKTFVIPDDVCSRYMVFSAVGLLPFVLMGINIDDILQGVKDMDLHLKNTDIHHNLAAQIALIHYLADKKLNKKISVMMPYCANLDNFVDWYIQLWAESLGKEYNRNHEKVNIGQTPLKAIGCKDQYSQLQLFNEGPNDKIFTFIRLKNFDNKIEIPKIFEYTGIGYLGSKTLNDLMSAEADATQTLLTDFSRPNITLTIPYLNAYYVGQLLYLYEIAAAILGELYNIDIYNQDSIEQIKDYTYGLMGCVGYEESANHIKEKLNNLSPQLN